MPYSIRDQRLGINEVPFTAITNERKEASFVIKRIMLVQSEENDFCAKGVNQYEECSFICYFQESTKASLPVFSEETTEAHFSM